MKRASIVLVMLAPLFAIAAATEQGPGGKSGDAAPAVPQNAYRFTGGEKIKLVVPLIMGESIEQIVSDDGYIALPLGGVVNIKGKTIPEAQAAALEGLAANSDNRKISIALAILEQPVRRVYVSGEVNKPQMIALTTGTPLYLAGAIAGAEGGTAEADLSRVKMVRTAADGKRQTITYDASKLASPREDESSDVGPELKSGDVITVPRGEVFILAGEVAKPGAFNRKELFLNTGEPARVSRVLFAGGGLKLSANRKELKLIRTRADGKKELIPVNLDEAIKSHAAAPEHEAASAVEPARKPEADADPLLKDGDIIFAGTTGGVAILGKVRLAGIYPLGGDHIKLTRLIALAGGFSDYAKSSSVSIIRATDPKHVIHVDVSSITKDGNSEQDLELDDGDLVFVGERIL